jgi:hypothetical protein
MNLLMAPALVSLADATLLALAVGAAMVLQLSPRLAPAGKSLLWYSSTSLWMAIIFAWLGPFVIAPALGLALGERGIRVGLWASGPVGLLAGLVWARRHPGGQHVLRGKPRSWWILGGAAFLLLGFGLWLAWQSANAGAPPNLRMGFWPWLARTAGLK